MTRSLQVCCMCAVLSPCRSPPQKSTPHHLLSSALPLLHPAVGAALPAPPGTQPFSCRPDHYRVMIFAGGPSSGSSLCL